MFHIDIDQSERLSEVVVEVTEPPLFGSLSHKEHGKLLRMFSYSDIMHDYIVYTLKDSYLREEKDSFKLQFSIGHGQSAMLSFPVCIAPLPYPILKDKTAITVPLKGEVVITNRSLHSIQTRYLSGAPELIHYHIVRQPQYGLLVNLSSDNSATSLTSFTQADIDDQCIAYINHRQVDMTNSKLPVDKFKFNISNQYYKLNEVKTLEVNFKALNLTVINTGFTVTEGSSSTIKPSQLFAIAPKGYSTKIYILEQPKHGVLILTRLPLPQIPQPTSFELDDISFGYVSYNHSDQESPMDNFRFLIHADLNRTNHHDDQIYSGLFNISVDLVNDNPPVRDFKTRLLVVEDGEKAITTEILRYSDPDSNFNPEDLKYILKWRLYVGKICLRNNCTTEAPFEWYQRDMHGDLIYKHVVKGRRSDFLLFSVSDGEFLSKGEVLFIDVQEIIAERIANASVIVVENENVTLTSANTNFRVNETSILSSKYVYTVTRLPSFGVLLNSSNSSPIQTFTQADINSGMIMYNHSGENSMEDSFLFTINVKTYETTNNLVKIVIIPVDDDTPVLSVNKPLFVTQGSLAHINESLLAITDTDTVDPKKLIYMVSKVPSHGLLKKRFSTSLTDFKKAVVFTQDDIDHSKIRYEHTRLHDQHGDVWLDSLSFQIYDSTTLSPILYTMNVVIVPKTVVPVTTHGLVVNEGGLARINASSIIITHPYFAKTDGKVSIYGPITAGHLVVNEEKCTVSKCSFQLSDIKAGHVYYRHDDTETTQGGFQFVILWDSRLPDSGLIQYNITVLPVNDQRPMISNNTKLCLYAAQTVTLTSQYLLTIDKDTPPEKLFYHFYITPSQKLHGHFSVNNTQQDTFSQADINTGHVQFVDQHSFDGHPLQLRFNVSDGKFNSSGTFIVVATVVDLSVNVVPITVSMGGHVVIDHSVVHALTNMQEIPDSSIFFYIGQNDGQKYGQIVDSANLGRNLKEIRQSDIFSGKVTYAHKAIDMWESFDYVNMTVFHPLALKSRSVSLEIKILLLDDPTSVFAVKKQLHVNEGGKTCLNQSMLDARNIRYSTWKNFTDQYSSLYDLFLMFNVTNQPRYGSLLQNSNNRSPVLSFNQSDLVEGCICYQNDGSESNSDNFSVNVFILDQKGVLLSFTSDSTVNINISLLNDEKPVLAVMEPLNKTFVQGFPDIISSIDLRVVDEDNPPQDLEYTVVTRPQFGKFKLGDDEANQFTQADIDEGRLSYLPDLVGSTKFQFKFSDHLHLSKTYWFHITVEKVSLSLMTLKSLEYTQTHSTVIVTRHILDTKTNGNRNETVFTVTKAPQNGQIVVLNEVRTSFTQSEVDANLVLYKQINKTEYRDNVTLFGTNLQASTSEFTLAIKVLMQGKVNNNITLHPLLTQPLPSELIDLTEVRSMSPARPPRIQITSTFQYGYISYRYPNRDVSSIPISSFDYDDLHNHLVYFTWMHNPSLKLDHNYTENVTGVVWVGGISPGEFSLSLILQPPSDALQLSPSSTKLDASSTPTNPGKNAHNAHGNGNGFLYAFYLPLIGLVLVIVIVLIVLIFLYCSQPRRLKLSFKGHAPASSPEHKLSVAPSHPPYSEDIGQDYSDSESSSAADIMMVQNAQQQMHSGAPLMAVSASHTHVPHNQLSQEHGSSSGYHTHTTVAVTPFSDESNYTTSPAQHRHLDSPVGTSFHPSPLHFAREIEIRSNSPVRRINSNRRNIPQYSSMTRVTLDRSSPVKNFREYPASTALQFSRSQIRDSSSSLGYDSSSLTQESSRQSRPPSALTPVAMDKTIVKQDEADISSLYRTTHPVLKAPQYWV